MAEENSPIDERIAAQKTLLSATRRVGDALPPFSTWLLAGFGAAFSLVLANIETVSKFIAITHIRFALLIFLASLVVAVLATYISTVVKAGLGAQDDGETLAKQIVALPRQFDVALYMSEFERGLLPPIRWIVHAQMNKAIKGDVVASVRMIAKLSQIQALLVVCQSILAVVAVGAMAVGLKMQ